MSQFRVFAEYVVPSVLAYALALFLKAREDRNSPEEQR